MSDPLGKIPVADVTGSPFIKSLIEKAYLQGGAAALREAAKLMPRKGIVDLREVRTWLRAAADSIEPAQEGTTKP